MHCYHFKRPSAFTLLELLLAVSIIAVLAVLAFQVAKAAHEKASFTICTSNLRQIGAGLAMYAADNNGDLPYSPKMPQYEDWSSCLIYDQDIQDWRYFGRLYPYLRSKSIFYCKQVTIFNDHQTVNFDPHPPQSIWGSYCMRGYNQSFVVPGTIKLRDWNSRAIGSCFMLYSPAFAESQNAQVCYHNDKYPVLFGEGAVLVASRPSFIKPEDKPPIWESPSLQFQIWDQFDKLRGTPFH